MKSIVLLFSILLSIQAFAQKDPYGLVVTDADMAKFSENTKSRMQEQSAIICRCIEDYQEPFDNVVEYAQKLTAVKAEGNEKELETISAQINETISTVLPFVKCMAENKRKMPELEDREAFDKEFIDAFSDYDVSGENLAVVKMRVGLYYIKEKCNSEEQKFNIFSAFMNGFSKGMKK